MPDISEPRQEAEKRFVKDDPLANRPAMAVAYHMPERNTPEYFAMGLLDQILVQGNNSLLSQKLEKEKGFTSGVYGGINYLGNMFNYNGPMIWMYDFKYDNETSEDEIFGAIDEVMSNLKENLNEEMMENAIVKMRSYLYDEIGGFYGIGRADLLCTLALFDDDPSRINTLEDAFRSVTLEVMHNTIDNYLRKSNRTILTVNPLMEN